MKAYIKGMGNISPQLTWTGDSFLDHPYSHPGNCLLSKEPEYTDWISAQQLRRMSRILKLGTTAALIALRDAGLDSPEHIITGTGLGCLADTATFLEKIAELKEEALNPTPFMQSTHNAIGSQIGLMVKCRGYNQTYVQGPFSFEHSLLDACMQLEEQGDQHILVGGVDELTESSYAIQNRFRLYKQHPVDTLTIFQSKTRGTIAGEGAAYFVLSGVAGESKVCLRGVQTYYKPKREEIVSGMYSFLSNSGLNLNDIDLVLVGKSGDDETDREIDGYVTEKFRTSRIGAFKHLCGEHMVASSFALWLAAQILVHQRIPEIVLNSPAGSDRPLQNILIYNRYFSDHHTFLLVCSC